MSYFNEKEGRLDDGDRRAEEQVAMAGERIKKWVQTEDKVDEENLYSRLCYWLWVVFDELHIYIFNIDIWMGRDIGMP